MEHRVNRPGKPRTKKGFMVLLMILSFVLQWVIAPMAMAGEDNTPVSTSKYMPVIQFANSVSVSGTAGETLRINLHIKNTSFYSAKNIRIKPVLDADSPFLTSNSPSTFLDELIPNGTDVIYYSLDISPDAVEKVYPLKFNFEYYNYYGDYFGGNTSSPSDVIYIKVTNVNTSPCLSISAVNSLERDAGTPADVMNTQLMITNIGTLPARDIRITLQGLKDNGLQLYQDSNLRSSAFIDGKGGIAVSYALRPSGIVDEGNYGLTVKLEYKDKSGKEYAEDHPFSVKVTKPNTPPRLKLNAVTSLADEEGIPAEVMNTQLFISNLGNLPARDIKVTLQGLKDDGFGLYQDSNLKTIAAIEGYSEAVISYSLRPSGKMSKGNYGLIAKIEYKDQSGKEYANEHQFFVDVEKRVSKNSVPKIILDQYSNDPGIVKAGENFRLNLSFLNTSPDKTVSNIKVFFTVPEGGTNGSSSGGGSGSVFSPVNSSNTIYIDSIPPKGMHQKTLEFYTIPDAAPKTYTLTANFEYEDENGESYEAKELIGVPVSQQLKLETSEFTLPPEVFLGEPTPVAVDFYNTGKAKLSNLMLKLEGDFDTQNATYYVGNFEVGASDYFEGMLIAKAPGPHEGALIISYDEPTGEHMEIRKDFTVNAVEMSMPEMPPGFNPEGGMIPKGDSSKKLWIGLGIVVSAIVVIVFLKKVVVNKLIRRKKGLTLDE